jgi:hypothetical protein
MATPNRTPHEPSPQAGPRDPVGPEDVTPASPPAPEGAARRSYRSAPFRARPSLLFEQLAATPVGPDEALVPDARRDLTPAQQVDQRVLDVLGTGHPGRFSQAAGRPHDLRRIPRQDEAFAPEAGAPNTPPDVR